MTFNPQVKTTLSAYSNGSGEKRGGEVTSNPGDKGRGPKCNRAVAKLPMKHLFRNVVVAGKTSICFR